jgi:carboxymethylenebutenolidase
MKRAVILMIACTLLSTHAMPASESSAPDVHAGGHVMLPGGSMLPSRDTARDVLNATGRHPDWLRIPAGSSEILTFATYPDRADKAPVLIISEKDKPMSDWMRAVADQAAGEGFIALVPDSLSGLSQTARVEAVRRFALTMAPANGKIASITFDGDRIDVGYATFANTQQGWTGAINLLNTRMDNHPALIALPPHNHIGHDIGLMAMAEPQRGEGGGGGGQRGCPVGSLNCKADGYLAGFNSAKSTLAHTPVKSEWVDIPVGNAKLHTKIAYPPGDGKAGIILVMSGATGQNDWQLAVGDELARQGFIAISPDLHSGFGPNGGNYDSFAFPDDVAKASALISNEESMRRYKAARDYGMKLPRANGKSASIGFCGGGTHSFDFAVEIPDLSAAVVYYGTGPKEADMAKIKAPVLGMYGEIDSRITSTVDATTALMKKLGKYYEPHIYKGATHAFVQYQNLGENTAATKDSWPRTIAFLKEHLN